MDGLYMPTNLWQNRKIGEESYHENGVPPFFPQVHPFLSIIQYDISMLDVIYITWTGFYRSIDEHDDDVNGRLGRARVFRDRDGLPVLSCPAPGRYVMEE